MVCAPAIGPSLGGWITDNYNWRWIFFINLPIGLFSLFLTHRFVHDPPSFAAERSTVRDAACFRKETSAPSHEVDDVEAPGQGRNLLERAVVCWAWV